MPFPAECDDCPKADWEYWGCGRHGFEGKSHPDIGEFKGSDEEPYTRTCPQYYRRLPWIQGILADLEDYRRGAMGNAMLIAAPYLQLLRVADVESANWLAAAEQQLMEQSTDG